MTWDCVIAATHLTSLAQASQQVVWVKGRECETKQEEWGVRNGLKVILKVVLHIVLFVSEPVERPLHLSVSVGGICFLLSVQKWLRPIKK